MSRDGLVLGHHADLTSNHRGSLVLSRIRALMHEAGQGVGVWVESETYRRGWVGAEGYDNFNLILAWAREAQRQCASGSNERAVKNFRAIEGLIATIEERRRPSDEND